MPTWKFGALNCIGPCSAIAAVASFMNFCQMSSGSPEPQSMSPLASRSAISSPRGPTQTAAASFVV